MAGPVIDGHLRNYRYYDTVNSGVNPIAAYQCVSLLDASNISSLSATEGVAVRAGVESGTTVLERIAGISEHSAKHNTQLAVRCNGIAHVMVNAAVAYGALTFMANAEERTNSQTPLTDLFEINLPVEPGVGITYNLAMVDDTAITPASTGSNALFLPVGYAMETASAKYNVICVELFTTPFYA